MAALKAWKADDGTTAFFPAGEDPGDPWWRARGLDHETFRPPALAVPFHRDETIRLTCQRLRCLEPRNPRFEQWAKDVESGSANPSDVKFEPLIYLVQAAFMAGRESMERPPNCERAPMMETPAERWYRLGGRPGER